MKPRNSRGFTIMELLITIALLSVAAVLLDAYINQPMPVEVKEQCIMGYVHEIENNEAHMKLNEDGHAIEC